VELSTWFWIIYFLGLLIGWWGYYDAQQPVWYRRGFGFTAAYLLIGILGYHVFGSAVKGN
jgi:hypothetical protein